MMCEYNLARNRSGELGPPDSKSSRQSSTPQQPHMIMVTGSCNWLAGCSHDLVIPSFILYKTWDCIGLPHSLEKIRMRATYMTSSVYDTQGDPRIVWNTALATSHATNSARLNQCVALRSRIIPACNAASLLHIPASYAYEQSIVIYNGVARQPVPAH